MAGKIASALHRGNNKFGNLQILVYKPWNNISTKQIVTDVSNSKLPKPQIGREGCRGFGMTQ